MIGLLIAIVAVSVVTVTLLAMFDNAQWTAFAADHHCRLTGETRSDFFWSGRVGYHRHWSAYICDDGVTYWRRR